MRGQIINPGDEMGDHMTPQEQLALERLRSMRQAAEALAEFKRAMRSVAEAYAAAGRRAMASPVMQELRRVVNSPEGQALIAAHKAGLLQQAPRHDCHCLCAYQHGDEMGVCTGEATNTLPCYSEMTGHRDVPMCTPCWTRATSKAGQR